MMIMGLCGIALVAVGFTVLIMNRFQQTESMYFSEAGKRAKGRIVSTQKEAEEAHFGAENVKSYEIKVAYELEEKEGKEDERSPRSADKENDTGDKWVSQNGISQNALARMKELGIDIDENEDDGDEEGDEAGGNEIEAIGIFNGEQLNDIEHTPGAEIEFFYDTNNPARVIFYDPAAKAAKTSARNKIALVVMIAGVAVFLIGRIMM